MSDRVRRKLVATLYTQPSSLAIGALSGVICTAIAAGLSKEVSLAISCFVLAVIAIARVTSALAMKVDDNSRSTKQLELVYEIGAYSYALTIGIIAALSIHHNIGRGLEILMVAYALSYGVAICARNAGRPVIAMVQFLLVVIPIFIAALLQPSTSFLILAVNLFLLIPAMASITMNVFKVLYSSIASAETSAKLAEKMRIMARTDVVTGLHNRAGLNHLLKRKLQNLKMGQNLALFWMDLDRFKEVNDLLGHPVGDQVLKEVANRLRDVCPENAEVSRFGGDEFIIFADVDDRRESERLASEIHAETMRPFRIDGERLEIGASIGVALLPEDASTSDSLMKSADLALYHAKTAGRKQTCFYDDTMRRDLARRREIEAELRSAIIKDELTVYFQPIVDLKTGRIRSFEALVRWFHPTKGELRPDEFIPVAEETGVIVTLGNWVTAKAAKTAAQWPDDVSIAINLSPLQIKAPGATLGVRNALREAKLDPKRLILEVTESLFIDDNFATEAFIEELSEMGVRFALDDFGTGYSSLSHIQKYPFSKIKVDRSFVSGPDTGKKTDAIIHAVAELGSKLEMDIVAEGLETIEQIRNVKEAGCTLGQGYYYSRPVPEHQAATLLAEQDEADTRQISNG